MSQNPASLRRAPNAAGFYKYRNESPDSSMLPSASEMIYLLWTVFANSAHDVWPIILGGNDLQ
jgi:hypothetical protein